MSTARRRSRGRGGQGGHEPRTRIRTRELRALELSVLGWSQLQIAADLGITQQAVSKLLKRIELRLLREMSETVQRQKVRHTLRLEHVFTESMHAWTDSKTESTRRRQRQTHGGEAAGTAFAELIVENQHGDPRYLEEARKALADLRKLWGLDAPQKVDLHASRDRYDDMTEDALRAELAQQTQLLASTTLIDATTTDGGATHHTVDTPVSTPSVSPSPEKDTMHADEI